jgi:hypothetical protein
MHAVVTKRMDLEDVVKLVFYFLGSLPCTSDNSAKIEDINIHPSEIIQMTASRGSYQSETAAESYVLLKTS